MLVKETSIKIYKKINSRKAMVMMERVRDGSGDASRRVSARAKKMEGLVWPCKSRSISILPTVEMLESIVAPS